MTEDISQITEEKKRGTRVRFAPSPTGYLHIGSARTALFNWLFARKSGGSLILRIEDTDIERHMEETIGLIMDSLKWLGINWDEGPDIGGAFAPYRQSERTAIYNIYAEKLIGTKKAYHCFCSPEKLDDKRKKLAEKDLFFKYDRECLKLTEDKVLQNIKDGLPYAVRLKVPENKAIAFNDTVYGEIKVNSNILEDFIIIRSNGRPTYNFSAAVDDILMEITNVIRGEDHLSNTPKQILVYEALEKNVPIFTHLPMILGADGSKLSKRHGSVSIEAYRDEGFLPEAIDNYLALLGWAYDEKTTVFSTDELTDKFSIDAINKKPSKFDYEKLLWLNGFYLRSKDDSFIAALLSEKLKIKGVPENELDSKLPKIIPLIKERIKTINQAQETARPFFFDINYPDDLKEYFAGGTDETKKIIETAIPSIEKIKEFTIDNIETCLRVLAEESDISFKKYAETIRVAVWGAKVSPPLFETIEVLGKKTTIERLKRFKKYLN
jgi:nondiscriminating glutamyl-tRNA synthetase